MSAFQRAQFQEAAVRHIVARLRDRHGSRRMLLADEVGLGKTVVASGVIETLLKGRRKPLTVIYLCSNAEIAEQNRKKLDPDSRRPIGRVTELALERPDESSRLLLYSFTPGTSLKDGTGLAWERRLLMYLLHRIYGFEVWKRDWREFFRCGVREDRWQEETTRQALFDQFERKTSVDFQRELGVDWRSAMQGGQRTVIVLRRLVSEFDSSDPNVRTLRNSLVAQLRGVMQRVVLRYVRPDLVILDEVQRFRDVLEEAANSSHIAAELFARRVPVLILSATPYRALTLGHEVTDGAASHHEDFFRTLDFLFDQDRVTPARIRGALRQFGVRLQRPDLAQSLDSELLRLKQSLEEDLTQVICRTERNWYVLDRRKGIDDTALTSGDLPTNGELEEYFRLHSLLSASSAMGQVTEFWKSAPSLLTFLDGRYALLKQLDANRTRVPSELLTPGDNVDALARRNHRISRVVDIALGSDAFAPRLWTAPTYTYYQDEFFGPDRPRKLLVFSGWRFVPKAVAIITSEVAARRFGGDPNDPTQPLHLGDKKAFHVFDVCFPSPTLARIGGAAFVGATKGGLRDINSLVASTAQLLRVRLNESGVRVVERGADSLWQVVMRLERESGNAALVRDALREWVSDEKDEPTAAVVQHKEWTADWLTEGRGQLELSEARLQQLALIAAFSPANCVFRALESVYGTEEVHVAFAQIFGLCFGSLRRYFNRPHVQQIVRQHQYRLRWRETASEAGHGYAERVLVYSGDAHLQAVLDEYVHLLRHASQSDTVEKATKQLQDVWKLSRGTPRTNGASGSGSSVRIKLEANSHATHFALAFGEDESRDTGPDSDEGKVRKSAIREAFNSPFWPFVLATTSVGQEGLDFHLYCRDVLHWNLPSNPVDLEQREGRINRRDCLAVRESIGRDWPLTHPAMYANGDATWRNPWSVVFDRIDDHDDVQKYKHGLFPHWVYECREAKDTVRIHRHVPLFATSRDALKYERLKTGLALYRLVFGQMNQEDLLQNLQQQIELLDPQERDKAFRRLASYMLNLSPFKQSHALQSAQTEAATLLADTSSANGLKKLLAKALLMVDSYATELGEAEPAVRSLVRYVEGCIAAGSPKTKSLLTAVAALAYLRNPYDHIFDLHVEGGFADDIAVVNEAWAAVCGQVRRGH